MQEGASEGTVVTLGDISSANVQGRDPNGGAFMGNNGPHMESEGGVLGYWTRVSDMEVCTSVMKYRLKQGFLLHLSLHGFIGERGTGSRFGPTASGTCTRASLSSFLRHLKVIQLTGQGAMY